MLLMSTVTYSSTISYHQEDSSTIDTWKVEQSLDLSQEILVTLLKEKYECKDVLVVARISEEGFFINYYEYKIEANCPHIQDIYLELSVSPLPWADNIFKVTVYDMDSNKVDKTYKLEVKRDNN